MGGWTVMLADMQAFLAAIRWDRPACLWLGLWPIVASLMAWMMGRRDRSRLAILGTPTAIDALIVDRPPRPRSVRFLTSLAWLMLAIALAGPRGGEGVADGIAIGRDYALVLDFSRSMRADDMPEGLARWQSAVASAKGLVEELKGRGGHRLSLTIFAARPKLIAPLTTDFDHIRRKLSELDGRFPSAEIRPDRDDAPSGTRIGAGVAAAVASFDNRSGATGEIILWSDGDDPADDREWRLAIDAARSIDRPIHVIAVGDPDVASLIPIGAQPLEFEGPNGVPDPVRTKRHDDVLKPIATETRGEFRPLLRQPIDWPSTLKTWLDGKLTRELADGDITSRRNRAGGFYVGAAILVSFGWIASLRWKSNR